MFIDFYLARESNFIPGRTSIWAEYDGDFASLSAHWTVIAGATRFVWRDRTYRFDDILGAMEDCQRDFVSCGLRAGSTVALEADYSPAAVAALLALMKLGAIAVPLTASVASRKSEFCGVRGWSGQSGLTGRIAVLLCLRPECGARTDSTAARRGSCRLDTVFPPVDGSQQGRLA